MIYQSFEEKKILSAFKLLLLLLIPGYQKCCLLNFLSGCAFSFLFFSFLISFVVFL